MSRTDDGCCSIRDLKPDELSAFEGLRGWLDSGDGEIPSAVRRRLRVFFQDHPASFLCVAELVE